MYAARNYCTSFPTPTTTRFPVPVGFPHDFVVTHGARRVLGAFLAATPGVPAHADISAAHGLLLVALNDAVARVSWALECGAWINEILNDITRRHLAASGSGAPDALPRDIIGVSVRLARFFTELVHDSLLSTGGRGSLVDQVAHEAMSPFVHGQLAALYNASAPAEVPPASAAAHAACCGHSHDTIRAHMRRTRYAYAVRGFAAEVSAAADKFTRDEVLALLSEFWMEAARQRAALPPLRASGLACAICWTEFTGGSDVVVTQPCSHLYCRGCLATWAATNARCPCPVCRIAVKSCRGADDVMGLLRRLDGGM